MNTPLRTPQGKASPPAHLPSRGLTLSAGTRFCIRLLTLAPGEKLGLHRHLHRTEYFCAVQGTALATVGQATGLIPEGGWLAISCGTPHAIENPGRIPLLLVEIQGGICRADDIELTQINAGAGHAG